MPYSKHTNEIMNMPITVEVVDVAAKSADIEEVFTYFRQIDTQFSTFKKESEISRINRGELRAENASPKMQKIFQLCEQTQKETHGFFDIHLNGILDPSGLVKGLAIHQGAELLRKKGYHDFYVEIAGDIEVSGHNHEGKAWRVGIQNPFNLTEVIKVTHLSGQKGIATSGNYQRGKHIYDPVHHQHADEIASITVIGPNVYDADRFATAAFAMGESGLDFIENLPELEAYMVTKDKHAFFTTGFADYAQTN